jgi:hypothetical protein
MTAKLLTLVLAVAVATAAAAGGVTAVPAASTPNPDAQPDERPTADGYEFAVTDHDDWLADREADADAVAERLLADEAVGAELRELFDADTVLALDVYGSLQQNADSAHVIVTPAPGIEDSSAAEQDPRIEATVDLGDGTVEFVGASTQTDDDVVQRNASEVDATTSVSVGNTTGDVFTARTFGGEVVDAESHEVVDAESHEVVDVLVNASGFPVEIVDPAEPADERDE